MSGSSPRVWGTDPLHQSDCYPDRFIPTRVGNGRLPQRRRTGPAVHPHACGERMAYAFESLTDHGSSPRVWGTVSPLLVDAVRVRFIPTRVGNGCHSARPWLLHTVHPHACGERTGILAFTGISDGSSPRVWGTGKWWPLAMQPIRFIPTRVGNGSGSGVTIVCVTVHPHACGERLCHFGNYLPQIGSSPRVWGTGNTTLTRGYVRRFIPTRVGNGSSRTRQGSVHAVHPHACGEREENYNPLNPDIGSSPRVWGTAARRLRRSLQSRFIPTRVGNGTSSQTCSSAPAVHPHACGERWHPRSLLLLDGGSSPRVWGTVGLGGRS